MTTTAKAIEKKVAGGKENRGIAEVQRRQRTEGMKTERTCLLSPRGVAPRPEQLQFTERGWQLLRVSRIPVLNARMARTLRESRSRKEFLTSDTFTVTLPNDDPCTSSLVVGLAVIGKL